MQENRALPRKERQKSRSKMKGAIGHQNQGQLPRPESRGTCEKSSNGIRETKPGVGPGAVTGLLWHMVHRFQPKGPSPATGRIIMDGARGGKKKCGLKIGGPQSPQAGCEEKRTIKGLRGGLYAPGRKKGNEERDVSAEKSGGWNDHKMDQPDRRRDPTKHKRRPERKTLPHSKEPKAWVSRAGKKSCSETNQKKKNQAPRGTPRHARENPAREFKKVPKWRAVRGTESPDARITRRDVASQIRPNDQNFGAGKGGRTRFTKRKEAKTQSLLRSAGGKN